MRKVIRRLFHLSLPPPLLTGSSARKLRRGHANLLGGRAWCRTLVPLSFLEVEVLPWKTFLQRLWAGDLL